MRRLTTGERWVVGTGSVLLVLGAAGCGGGGTAEVSASSTPSAPASAEASASVKPGNTVTAIGATVINGKDRTGRSVGVRSYVSPWDNKASGIYPEGERLELECITPHGHGRSVVDTDVPVGSDPVKSEQWYKLNTGMKDWMGDGYVKPDGPVPECTPGQMPPSPVPAPPHN